MSSNIAEVANSAFDYVIIGIFFDLMYDLNIDLLPDTRRRGVQRLIVDFEFFAELEKQTSGLTVAERLAENPEISVVVLEAGQDRSNDIAISTLHIQFQHQYGLKYLVVAVPGQFGSHFGNSNYDWDFKTAAQDNADGQVYPWSRGKLLGGSSAINFMVDMRLLDYIRTN